MSVTSKPSCAIDRAVRRRVVAGLFVLSFVTIPDLTFGVVFAAFALGYALFTLPSGWLADRWGPRKFLTATVACWPLFSLAAALDVAAVFCWWRIRAGSD